MSKSKTGKWKTTTMEALGAVEAAITDLESLRDEMQEWASNMESSPLEHTEKCQRVRECADALDSAHCELEGKPDEIMDLIRERVFEFPEALTATFKEFVPYKGRSLSRADRLSNATNMFTAGLDSLKDAAKGVHVHEIADDDESAEGQKKEDQNDALDELIGLFDEAESAWTEAEAAEFPGMFG